MASSKFADNKQAILLGQSVQEQVKKIDENFDQIVLAESDLQTQIDGKEPKITKNTAFNKNFSGTDPLMDGTASPGSADTVARGDHTHPTDTSRLAVNPNGTDNLIVSGKINTAYIPDSVLGQVSYIGTWDASTGVVSTTWTKPVKGDYFICTKNGSKDPQVGTKPVTSQNSYNVGDWAIVNGVDTNEVPVWGKVDNTDAVTSVNNRIGAVKTYQGEWSNTPTYYAGDMVMSGNSLYLAIAQNQGKDPTSSDISGFWKVFGAVVTVNGQVGDVNTFKGTWAAGVTYYKGDIIQSPNIPHDLYLCLKDSPLAFPDATSWKIFGKVYSKASDSADGLMSKEDFTKLNGIAEGANKTIVDTALSATSTNPVQNQVVNTALGGKVDKVAGKGLSSNDFTDAYKDKLDDIDLNNIGNVLGVTVNGQNVVDATDKIAKITIDDLASDYIDIAMDNAAWTTQNLDGTNYQAIRLAATETALGVFVNNKEIVVQKVYDGANGYLYLVVGTEKVACTIRKLSGGAVGTGGGSGSGDVTAAGNNTFTGTNIFNGEVRVNGTPRAQIFKAQLDDTMLGYAAFDFEGAFEVKSNTDGTVYDLRLPRKTGTLATLNDIPKVTTKYLHHLYITGYDTTAKYFTICAMHVNNSDTAITTFAQLLTAVSLRRMMATGWCGGTNSSKPVYYLEQSTEESNRIIIHSVTNSGDEAVNIGSNAISEGGIIDTVLQI